MFYFTLGEGIESSEENTTENTTESTTENVVSTPSDAWTTEKVDSVINYVEGLFILVFFIVIYLMHSIIHKILIKNTNEMR